MMMAKWLAAMSVSATVFAPALFGQNAFVSAVGNAKAEEGKCLFPYWTGEYPNGYQVLKTITVKGHATHKPHAQDAGESCTIEKDWVIHPWAKKHSYEFMTYSPLVKFEALSQQTIPQDKKAPLVIEKGVALFRLTFLSEGQCKISLTPETECAKGIDAPCPVAGKHYRQITQNPAEADEWFSITCKEGKKLWVHANELLIQKGKGNVKNAEIKGYPEVKEP